MMNYTILITHQKQHPLSGLLVPRILLMQQEGLEGNKGNTAEVEYYSGTYVVCTADKVFFYMIKFSAYSHIICQVLLMLFYERSMMTGSFGSTLFLLCTINYLFLETSGKKR